MRKLFVLVVCLLLLLNCVAAESGEQAWRVQVCSIEIQKENQGMMPTQEVELTVGRQGEGYWAQAIVQRSVDLKMQPCLTFQTKLEGNTLIGSIEGANDALQTEDAASFLKKYDMSTAEIENWLSGIFDMLETRTDPEIENFKVDFYKNGENGGYFAIELAEMKVRFQLIWERYDGPIPFDLGAENKTVHELDASALGEGTDLIDIFNAGLEELKKSSSFRAALEFILG